MSPTLQFLRTQKAVRELEAAGLFVDMTGDMFCVFKHGTDRDYDCWINCSTVQELEVLIRTLAAAPRLLKNPDYQGVEE
jgi:hypothetical protein